MALVTLVPALAFIAYNQAVERNRARAQAVDDAVSLARLAASGQASVLYGVERLLFTLSHVPALRTQPGCNALLASVLRDHPGYANIYVTRADGSTFCNGAPIAAGFSSAHRTWFERVIQTRKTAMSDFQVSATTGKPDVVVAEPLLGPDGAIEYVLAAGVHVSELGDVVQMVGMPEGSSLTIADRNGTILARYPSDPSTIGQHLPAALSLARARRASFDELIDAPGRDGTNRLHALVPVTSRFDSGMYVAMEIVPATMFAKANEQLQNNLWLLLIVAVAAIGGGLVAGRVFVLRPLEMLTRATTRIAAGDFAQRTELARSAPGLSDLGQAINEMALALEARERTRAEVDERLQNSERRYRLLFEASPHPMWLYDTETFKFLEVNDAAVQLYGYSRDEFLAMQIMDVLPREDVDRALEVVTTLRGDGRYSGSWRHRVKSGAIIDVEITSHAIVFNGRPARLGTAQDISERLRAEGAVRDAEERMRFALDAARVGVWEANLSDRRVYWSDQCVAIHAMPAGTFQGTMDAVMDCIHPDDRERVQAAFDDARVNRHTLEIEYRALDADGAERRISATGQFFYDQHGDAARAAGIVTDVTERGLLEEQLRQSQKMDAIGQLAGGIAHDFNNVLTAILGNTEIYLDDATENDPHRRTIEEIRTAGRAAANLTGQLLAFSRRQMLAPKVMRLGDTISEVTPMLRRLLGASIKLNTVLSDTQCVKADAGQIQQVLINLTVNARDAMPDGGRLTIETADVMLDDAVARRYANVRPGAYVLISVSDTGHGMDPATERRAFEPFFTTKPKGHGTGLGLATVHGIVRQSDGHVTVHSEVGKGTTFTVYLPVTTEREMTGSGARVERGALAGAETVLLVEDEAGVRDFVYRVLTRYGYRVYALPDPHHALEFAGNYAGSIDIIVTDIVLPDINGQVLATRIRSLHPSARVLYMSGYTDMSIITGGEPQPGAWFLKKPFTAEALGQRVRQILDAQLA